MLFDKKDHRCNDMLDTHCCSTPAPASPCFCPPGPIMEKPVQRCVTRDICHDVPHVCPIDTKVINNHICRHHYVPHYTCSEANVVSHVYTGSCCDFV